MNDNITGAPSQTGVQTRPSVQKDLNINFAGGSTAGTIPFEAGTIQVRVTDTHDPGRPIQGAQVIVRDGTTTLTQGNTDVNGAVTLEIPNLGSAQQLFTQKTITVVTLKNGFTQIAQSTKSVTVVAIATIDVSLALAPQ